LKVHRTQSVRHPKVTTDGEGVTSHAGTVLLAEMADRSGLTRALSVAMGDCGISIKQASGRLDTPADLLDAVAANDLGTVAITVDHPCHGRRALPAHHADPFDRMLIAQALRELLEGVSLRLR
jgi:hypothetical protein